MSSRFAAPGYAVDRPSLRQRLDRSLTQPLTLLVASAGSGKSVLLHQWASTHPEREFVWLDAVTSDNDPVRFSKKILSGLAAIRPEFADLVNLIAMHGGGLGTPLLEALPAQMAELPATVIVIDDFHRLSNSTLVDDLGRLVDDLPLEVHLVLASRADPPIGWRRHRSHREMTELRQSDLAFDEAESAELLERITGRPLGADSVTALVNRTEGWAAGLQLAGVTLRLQPDATAFVAQFSGDDRLVADYLGEEVLHLQTPDRRQFLLRSSVLNQMCAGLLSTLTGEPNAQLILEELERESMFLVPLDNHREWFRFHHLFRDLLRYRLRAEDPAGERHLLSQAASWYLQRGEVAVAVEYLLRGENWDGALDVILTQGSEVFERGEMATVIRWIDQIPPAARSDRYDVSLLLGVLHGIEGHLVGAEDVLRRVATHPKASAGERACAQTFLAALAQWRPNPVNSVHLAERALEMLDNLNGNGVPDLLNLTDAQSLETIAMISGGRAHFLAGHMAEARDWLERGLTTLGATYSIWRISGLGSLGLLESWCGRLARAEALADEALAVAREGGRLNHPSTADAYLALAFAALERGEPHRAALSLHEGTVRAEANRRSQLSWVCQLAVASLQAADGHPEDAGTIIRSSGNSIASPPPPIVRDRLLALHARLLRLGGHPERALQTLGRADTPSATLTVERVSAALTLDQPERARKILGESNDANWSEEPLQQVENLILRAWIERSEGSTQSARESLTRATALAEQYGLVEAFVRAGASIVSLFAALPKIPPGFRQIVLARTALAAKTPTPGGDLADPLTDREMEVLSYLPSRMSNHELAKRCFVSVNTIKTHTAHIYRKLDVVNRDEAVHRARELGLL